MNTYALLVPCYNAEKYLPDFFENIGKLQQKFDEILFYDDASEDHTVRILEDSGYMVIRGNENRGPAFARNALLEKTSCNWVHFHDCDDLLHPEYLNKVSPIVEQEKFDVILCNVDWLNEGTKTLQKSWIYSNEEIQVSPVEYTITNPIGGINGLYRLKAIKAIKGYNVELKAWEDADLHVRLAISDARFFVVEETLCFAIRHNNSISFDQKKAWQYRLKALEGYYLIPESEFFLPEVGLEAEKAATGLIIQQAYKEAKKALELASKCGVAIPSSASRIWGLFKHLLPKSFIIRLRLLQLKYAFKT